VRCGGQGGIKCDTQIYTHKAHTDTLRYAHTLRRVIIVTPVIPVIPVKDDFDRERVLAGGRSVSCIDLKVGQKTFVQMTKTTTRGSRLVSK
jgi:hypothetical protein